MSDKDTGFVNLATSGSPNFDAVQAAPFDSKRLFVIELAAGDDPEPHIMNPRTEWIGVTVMFTTGDGTQFVTMLRGDEGTAKRLCERDYSFSMVKTFEMVGNDLVASNPRNLTFTAPASGSVYIEIQEA
ncbi:hypothetical protein O9X99_01970 [Agrobacterium salinitolerans]|uniref:Uncharacterized protein n=1 Tax=Agrobacterium salinitolerans TaxID=1183413 RepID=A0ABY3BV13_9HYPH|nr:MULTISPECIES: hypothetical protein [Agrobacterium]MCZ7890434.1 hypothetical protein [Agrobacterium salinitolerans]TRA96844.1 hypothetical protein EXN23_00985 [Agrobacterium salinitolerans]